MDNTRKTVITAIMAVVLIGVVLGVLIGIAMKMHGAAGAPAARPTQTQTQAANPVTILRQLHVPIAPGVSVGQFDIYGDRYADGTFADMEQVQVYTYASMQAEEAGLARLGPSTDTNKVLVGHLFTVLVTGVDQGAGISFPTSAATLAQESGTVVE